MCECVSCDWATFSQLRNGETGDHLVSSKLGDMGMPFPSHDFSHMLPEQ